MNKESNRIKFSLPPKPEDLLPWSQVRLRKKRMLKKFLRHPLRWIPMWAVREWRSAVVGAYLRLCLREDGFLRRIMPPQVVPEFQKMPDGIVEDAHL